jgi:hypothetical protein
MGKKATEKFVNPKALKTAAIASVHFCTAYRLRQCCRECHAIQELPELFPTIADNGAPEYRETGDLFVKPRPVTVMAESPLV